MIFSTRNWLIEHRDAWLRPAAVVAVILFSIALAAIGSEEIWLAVVALPVAVTGFFVLMRWPALGLVAAFGSVMIAKNGPSGLNATMVVVALLLGLWVLDALIQRPKLRLSDSMIDRALLAMLGVAVLATVAGQLPWFSFARPAPLGAQLGGLALYFLSAGAFWLVAYRVSNERWLWGMVGMFLAVGAIYLTGRLVPPVRAPIDKFFDASATGSMFWAWMMAVAGGQAIFNKKLPWWGRLAAMGLAFATIYVAYKQMNGWKSGWVPPLVVLATLLALRSWRVAIVMAVGGAVLVPGLLSNLIASDAYSYSTRLDAWLILLQIIKVNPILGLGPANYHWYTVLFPIRGYAVQFNSHNQYVDMVAQTGLLGLMAFGWFAWEVGRFGWKLRRRLPEGFPQAYVYTALAGLVGTVFSGMLGDWFIPFFYNIGLRGFRASVLPWLFLGGLMALNRLYPPPKTIE